MKTLLLALSAIGMATAAQAHVTTFIGSFAPEAQGATGSGSISLEWDQDGHTLLINATFAGLSGNTSNAHIHCCTAAPLTGAAGVALASVSPTPPSPIIPGFPLGLKSGSYLRVIDLASTGSYTATFVTASGGTAAAAEARLMSNLSSGNAYFNIHTTTFGGGEIRAFVTAVPEPQTYALMLAGLGVLGWAARRRQVG
jgi:hypothetical protein